MDRFDNFEGGEFAREEQPCGRDAPLHEEDILAAFLRCKQDACRAIELATEEDSLEDAAWLALRQRLNQLAGTAGYFGEAELGLLARDLEHGLDILSPRGRTRRLRNTQAEFHRLAMRL